MTFKHLLVVPALLAISALGCGGGSAPTAGGGGGGPAGLRGIALPAEVSALPISSAPARATSSQLGAPLATMEPPAAPPADSDYALARTSRYMSEQALSQFDILNTIFDALAQTHYEDVGNVNGPAYSAIVSWSERNQGQEQKRLVKWVVESTRASETAPNVVKAWFRMPMGDGQPRDFRVKATITSAPVRNMDGSYGDYGEWIILAQLEGDLPFEFVASAERDAQGRAVVKLGKSESKDPQAAPSYTRGILIKSSSAGFGMVNAPNYQNCPSEPCPLQLVAYAYDASDVTLKKGTAAPITKSRASFVEIVNRYGLYDANTGEDVGRTMTFGFPVLATVGGEERFGFYGTWRGRHELWTVGSQLSEGLNVTRADQQPAGAPWYVASRPFPGVLVRRDYTPAQPSDVTGLVTETMEVQGYNLAFDGTGWCADPDLTVDGLRGTCGARSSPFTDFARLENNPLDVHHVVRIIAETVEPPLPDGSPPPAQEVVYLAAGPDGAGFYPARMDVNMTHPQPTSDVKRIPLAGDVLWVAPFGPVYVGFDGSTWVRKEVESFDAITYQPIFMPPEFDQPYQLVVDRDYYFDYSGITYLARLVDGQAQVRQETLVVAHPWDAAAVLPGDAELSMRVCTGPPCSTYLFVSDPISPDFMRVRYASVAGDDAASGKQVGDLVEVGLWEMHATIGGEDVTFNWEYPRAGQGGGVQQYLTTAGGDLVRLDDPIQLGSVQVSNATGSRSFTLQFDGNWMQGLPDAWSELVQSGFEVTEAIQRKVFSIPDGQVLGSFMARQLQVSQYMAPSSAPALDLTEALAIDLAAVPAWTENDIGVAPEPAPLKYSEGEPVPGT
jgi:hypothetical protein